MNKKLLFGIMSLAALAACTNDDFETQNGAQVSEQVSPIQFEVINNNEVTRASMNGSKIAWSAADGDLFTLYHGGCTGTGYQNATYKAEMGDGAATLTTPSMILPGKAIMTWPVDTTFKQGPAALKVSILAEQTNIENNIPYVSDVIDIKARTDGKGVYNYAGYDRKYPVYMRPMASQLTIKADYAGTESQIAELYTGANAIDPIKVTDIKLVTSTGKFTTDIPLTFTAKTTGANSDEARWNAAEPNNAWSDVVGFGTALASVTEMTAKGDCLLDGNQGCKFLILPQSTADGTSAVVVNTIYGKVVVAPNGVQGSQYVATTEDADIWYRYLSASSAPVTGETKAPTAETSGDNAGKFKTTSTIAVGMGQTFTAIDGNVAPATDKYVAGEQMGGAVTRYVKVLLKYLDMSDLHITSDKQLRDAARVWQHIGAGNVTVFLDGDDNKEFKMSKETIKAINEINAAAAEEATPRTFEVQPCNVAGEKCETIVITGGGDIQDLVFIKKNGALKADVALNEGENWNWKGTVKLYGAGSQVNSIINRGTMNNAETATLKIMNAAGAIQGNVPFVNNGTWNITAGDLTVQFDVTNLGIVNIAQGAEYHQDIANATATTFVNEALTVPDRFYQKDPTKTAAQKAAFVEQIGKVNNSGVFAVTGTSTVKGVINNYGRIEHKLATAKTYVTSNQQGTSLSFATPFNATLGSENKFGLINLPWDIRSSATNVSVSSALNQGFISLTYTGSANTGELTGDIGGKVNYVIVESGIAKVGELSDNIKYLEIAEEGTEIVFTKSTSTTKNKFDGLMVLSDVNVQQGVALTISKATFLAAKMYVGGTFTQGSWDGYYGATTSNYTSKYMTY